MAVETFKEEWRRWIKGPDYRILVIEGVDELDPLNDNVDVEVHFDDGRRYGGTLFTLENLHSLMENYRNTGECGGGSYFWASQMVIVPSLAPDALAKAIAALIAEGDLEGAFVRYSDDNDEKTV
jgi:hypothetical protein